MGLLFSPYSLEASLKVIGKICLLPIFFIGKVCPKLEFPCDKPKHIKIYANVDTHSKKTAPLRNGFSIVVSRPKATPSTYRQPLKCFFRRFDVLYECLETTGCCPSYHRKDVDNLLRLAQAVRGFFLKIPLTAPQNLIAKLFGQ